MAHGWLGGAAVITSRVKDGVALITGWGWWDWAGGRLFVVVVIVVVVVVVIFWWW